MIFKKLVFFLFLFSLFLFSSCGNKKSLTPTTANGKQATTITSRFLKYKVFYRQNILVFQAEVVDSSNDPFSFENLSIQFYYNNNIQEYQKEIIEQKKINTEIEITIFPLFEQRFFQLTYKEPNGLKNYSIWKKPILKETILEPKFLRVKVDYSRVGIPFPLLTLLFENLGDYNVILYEKNKIFPLLQFTSDIENEKLALGINSLLVRYADGYGNESKAVDISNWF